MFSGVLAGLLKVAAVVVVAGGVAVVLLAAACGGGEDSSPLIQAETTQLDQKETAAAKLYLAGRDDFRICVDGTEGASATTAQVDAVRRALELALPRAVAIASDRLSEIPSQYAAPTFVRGCPSADVLTAALAGEQLDRLGRNSMRADQIIGGIGPSAPNPHRVYVYFVESGTYTAAFGADRYISTSEEFICEGICRAVTRALYVPADAQNKVIQDGLLEVLSLLSGQQIRDLWQDGLSVPAAPTATSQPPNYDGLLTGNRATLDVCIQGSDGTAAGATDIARLSSALGDVVASEYYAAHYPPDPVVTEGCPASTLLQGIPVSSYRPSDRAVRLDDSQLASRHRVHVYMVPPDEYGLVFGDEPFFRVAAELICLGHQCGNVTTGVYVPSDTSTTELTTALLQVLGLQLPPADPVWDPAVVEEKIQTALEGGE